MATRRFSVEMMGDVMGEGGGNEEKREE